MRRGDAIAGAKWRALAWEPRSVKLEQRNWSPGRGWQTLEGQPGIAPSVVLFFAGPGTVDDGARFAE